MSEKTSLSLDAPTGIGSLKPEHCPNLVLHVYLSYDPEASEDGYSFISEIYEGTTTQPTQYFENPILRLCGEGYENLATTHALYNVLLDQPNNISNLKKALASWVLSCRINYIRTRSQLDTFEVYSQIRYKGQNQTLDLTESRIRNTLSDTRKTTLLDSK